jgi:hypothetical protein
MGASLFFTSASGSSAKEAFRDAVRNAAYESGHGGYTGTIAEKNEFVLCSLTVYSSFDEAYDFASQLIDNDDKRVSDKWGPAGCVKFMDNDKELYLFFGWASD